MSDTVTLPVPIPFHPLLVNAQPHLDKIDRQEFYLILGGLILPFIIIWCVLRSVAVSSHRKDLYSWTIFWLLLCAVIHSYLEMHFVFFRTGWIARSMDLYAAADFRYGTPLEAGTAAMEWITSIIVGPMCVLLAYSIVTAKPWRYALQIAVCTAQMYGLTWFILHPFFYHLPVASEDPFLFWVIFVGLNAPWGIFPPILAYKAFKAISEQFSHPNTAAALDIQMNGKKYK